MITLLHFRVIGAIESQASSSKAEPPVSRQQSALSQKGAQSTGGRPSTRINNLPGLKNVGSVAPGIYRGAQPAAEGYLTLKKMGIKTVINLRSSVSEREAVEAAGMRSLEIPLSVFNNGDKEKVDRVVAVMADPANRPVFVHCKWGRDRTGIVVAAYRMKVQGWSLAGAEAEMESFGFNDVWVNLRHFLRRYAAGLERERRQIPESAR